ncbi:MAG: tetratricopeptide repeat protein [Pseudomonas sp.]|uniref:O-linked N-acetylglucosamine transferase, SPINDLY family protein n=1 Tax=Pseudomonas sp. TaxID=306 RepID=UPI002735F877|nr:tetratricopeptide repeat protein [Pseudomonas sp.]MDP3846733.1 tetratricopeptide repeat protein [Pseudomonas sp.]
MPKHAAEIFAKALQCHQAGDFAQAQTLYLQTIQLEPKHCDALHFLGILSSQTGQHETATKLIDMALALAPSAIMHANIGHAYLAQNKYQAATTHYQASIELQADSFETHTNLGIALRAQGKFSAAVASFNHAITSNPNYTPAYNALGSTLKAQGKLLAAIQIYQQALTLNPNYADSHNNLGNAYQALGELDKSEKSYNRALSIDKNHVDAYNNLGNALQAQGRHAAALTNYHQAISLSPNNPTLRSNLLFSLSTYENCSAQQYREEAQSYGQLTLTLAKPFSQWPCLSAAPSREDKLRIGIVSGDLKTHPVGYFLESIVKHLNPADIELFAYTTQPLEDELTHRLQPYFSQWQSIVGRSDAMAAQLIHNDEIQILIDLAGHTAHNRLPVFAWKPAPVQVSWLGYFASTGVIGMDYILADHISLPATNKSHFSEKPWYLPQTRLCFNPPTSDTQLPVTSAPVQNNGYITFGCFQKLTKINDNILRLWGDILKALPHARLRLQNKQMNCPTAQAQLQQRLATFGIVAEQIIIINEMPRADYLEAYSQVDIILDTFPFTGGTTTCEALWMGVPTLTLMGNSMLARQGASLLSCVGLSAWIAHNENEYIDKALSFAANTESLIQLRSSLRATMLKSPITDAPRFAKNLELAFKKMWHLRTTS